MKSRSWKMWEELEGEEEGGKLCQPITHIKFPPQNSQIVNKSIIKQNLKRKCNI